MKFLLVSLILLSAPAFAADLGPADLKPKKEKPSSPTSLTAWCVNKYADCDVSVNNGAITVNQKHGLDQNRILSWERIDTFRDSSGFIGPHHLYIYKIKYINSQENISTAKFMFQNSSSSDEFYQNLKQSVGSKEKRCEYNFETRSVSC